MYQSNLTEGEGEMKQEWELAFEEWEQLLKRAKAEDLLQDPKAIWDEAWRHVSLISYNIIETTVPSEYQQEALHLLKKRLMR